VNRTPTRLVADSLAATLLLASCGGGSDDTDGAGGTETTTRLADQAATTEGPATTTANGEGSADESLEFVALDIAFQNPTPNIPAGEITITLVNEGRINHTLVIEGLQDFRLDTPGTGDVDEATVTLEPGLYDFFCDVPGHVDAGMVGTLAVT